jgi:hypothetical protein
VKACTSPCIDSQSATLLQETGIVLNVTITLLLMELGIFKILEHILGL